MHFYENNKIAWNQVRELIDLISGFNLLFFSSKAIGVRLTQDLSRQPQKKRLYFGIIANTAKIVRVCPRSHANTTYSKADRLISDPPMGIRRVYAPLPMPITTTLQAPADRK